MGRPDTGHHLDLAPDREPLAKPKACKSARAVHHDGTSHVVSKRSTRYLGADAHTELDSAPDGHLYTNGDAHQHTDLNPYPAHTHANSDCDTLSDGAPKRCTHANHLLTRNTDTHARRHHQNKLNHRDVDIGRPYTGTIARAAAECDQHPPARFGSG